ncbi:MAG: tRNA lysidine(34) synthetase TilS [Dehalococcoidia bacterium]|nr:tRNA lysidine(34) synthetase TilS [Dehalococcoidia bacterium]
MNAAFLARVARFAQQESLFRRARLVMVAVSGGPDSVACLLILNELRARFGYDIIVAHFDHQLRPDSVADLQWVSDLASRLELPFLSGEGDVAGVARQQKASLEDTARKMRYQFLGFVAAEKRVDCIATGHTADDQAETVLMRVLRGSGVRGIRGMLPSAPVPGATAQRLVRPLLPLTREETRAICAGAGIEPLQDASNDDVTLARNRVRHELLPHLEDVNPSVRGSLIGLAESARQVFAGIERQSHTVQPELRGPVGAIFQARALAALPNEALTLVLDREAAFYHLQPEVNRTRVNDLRDVLAAGSGIVSFGDAAIQVSSGRARIGPVMEAEPFEGKVLNVPGVTIAGPWRVEVSTSPLEAAEHAPVAAIDTSAQKGALRLRALAPGDRMTYHRIDRKVADVFANAKVPAWERIGAVAIADSARVHAVLTAAATFEADHSGSGEGLLYVRLGAAPRPAR